MPTDLVTVTRSQSAWRQLAGGLTLGAFALGAFPDRVPGLPKPQGEALAADALRLVSFLSSLTDVTGPTEDTYAVAMPRHEWQALERAIVRGSTAVSAALHLWGAMDAETHTMAMLTLVALQTDIASALRARSTEEDPWQAT